MPWILLVQIVDGDFQVLVGVSLTRRSYYLLGNVNLPTAQTDASPSEIACAKFSHDIAGLMTTNQIRTVMQRASCKVYLATYKRNVYIVHVNTDRTRKLPRTYTLLRKSLERHQQLLWLSWQEVTTMLDAEDETDTSERALWVEDMEYRLSTHLHHFVTSHRRDVEDHVALHVTHQSIIADLNSAMAARVDHLDKRFAFTREGEWILRLTSPLRTPPSPLEDLDSDDDDYEAMLALLPESDARRVVGMRRVRASEARLREYEHFKLAREETVTEVSMLYHGTPARWRATAIVTEGFDPSILLNGRCYGRGIYATTDLNYALQFTKTLGSVLLLRGLVPVSESLCKGVASTHIRVFADPAALLPELIVDFGWEDDD